MDRKWYAPQALAYGMPELEIEQSEISKDRLAAFGKEAAEEKEASNRMEASMTAQEGDLTNIHTGTRTARTEVVEPSGDTRPTEAGDGDDQLHTEQAGISSGQFKQTACSTSATPMNEKSSPAKSHNLLMMGT